MNFYPELHTYCLKPCNLSTVKYEICIAKSNKSELWNHLSYRGVPYRFEVRSQTFRKNCKTLRSQPQNPTSIVIGPQRPWKAQVRVLKKCPVSPIDAKNSFGFFVQFLGLAWTSR